MKIRNFFYFAQITSIVSYFRKILRKVQLRFIFEEIGQSLKNEVVTSFRMRKKEKIRQIEVARSGKRAHIF